MHAICHSQMFTGQCCKATARVTAQLGHHVAMYTSACPILPYHDDVPFTRCQAVCVTQDQASHAEDCCVGIRSGASDGEGSWHAVPPTVAGSRRAAGCRGGQEEQMGLRRGRCHEHAEGASPHQQHQQEPLPQVAPASLPTACCSGCHLRNTTGMQI